MKKLPLVALCLFASCSATPAELATYDAIAAEYSAYVQADPKLDAAAVQRRLDMLTTWAVRVGRQVAK